MHTDTWTSFLHVARLLATLKGTRPGDPLGSAIFNCVMSRVLRQQVAACRSEGLIESIAWSGIRSLSACDSPTSLVDISKRTIVDDRVFLFTAAVAEDLVAQVARVAKLQLVIFSRLSLQLDYYRCLSSGRAGKTAAIVAFRGKGAKLQYTDLVMVAQAPIAFAGDGIIPVTPGYKHLCSFSRS